MTRARFLGAAKKVGSDAIRFRARSLLRSHTAGARHRLPLRVLVAKAADVVGLYIAPPENAIVICVDEKPSIQALERAQGYLKLPNALEKA
jgi:hypothetical protein